MTRLARWGHFSPEVQIELLMGDQDEHEETIAGFKADLRGIQRTLIGVLIALMSATVAFAANLVIR